MTKTEAIKIIKKEIKKLFPCPFCGKIPEIKYRVEKKRSKSGYIGHFSNRNACCTIMGCGQTELFFCNKDQDFDYKLWCNMTCRLVIEWNSRKVLKTDNA